MTAQEFEKEYKNLSEAYPQTYGNNFRKELIAGCVRDLDKKWFSAIVKRIILNPHLRIDIDEAARNERMARSKYTSTQNELQAFDQLKNKMNDSSYDELLKKLGVKSLSDALFKK